MSVSTLKPVPCRIPPAIGVDWSKSKASKVTMMNRAALPPPQAQVKVKESFTPSRREMMQSLTAASTIGVLSLVLPAPAEARPQNATMRQKIMEKFEELRRKAGFPGGGGEKRNLKANGEEKKADGEISLPNVLNGKTKANGEEKKADGEISLPNVLNGKTAETTLP